MNDENVTSKTSLNAGQINILIDALAAVRDNVENYINTKYEMFGILAQHQLDAAIELLYEDEGNCMASIALLAEQNEDSRA